MDLCPETLVVEGGCGQLDIVLSNLLVNAIDALDKTPSPRIVVRTWAEDAYAVIAISDNGPGVPQDIRKRLFDPFFSTKEVGQGSGLGLSISQAIVTKRGGFIAYDAAIWRRRALRRQAAGSRPGTSKIMKQDASAPTRR